MGISGDHRNDEVIVMLLRNLGASDRINAVGVVQLGNFGVLPDFGR